MKIIDLNADLAYQVARHLTPGDVVRFGATCRDSRTKSADPRLWKTFVAERAHWGLLQPPAYDAANPRPAIAKAIYENISNYARTQAMIPVARDAHDRACADNCALRYDTTSRAAYLATKCFEGASDRLREMEEKSETERLQLVQAGVPSARIMSAEWLGRP